MPQRRLLSRTAMTGVIIALAFALLTPVSAGSVPRLPSVRLVGSADHLEVQRYPGEQGVGMELGTYLAAVGGPFEIRVRRNGDGYSASQVVPRLDGSVRKVRDLPDDAIGDISRGLRRFFTLTLSRGGETVVEKQVPLCIGGYEPARLNDSGPATPRYPSGCYSSELTRATVWGIDNGWAVRVPEYLYVDVPDGTYAARLAINPRYARLFDIADAHARTSLSVTVTTIDEEFPCEYPPEDPEPPMSDETGAQQLEEPCPPPGGPGEPGEPSEPMPVEESMHGSTTKATVARDASGLPDLIALPSQYIDAVVDERGKDVLVFNATAWNKGPGPLVVEGFRRRGQDLMDAYQYLYENGKVAAKLDAGTLEFDSRDGHDHWHFTDFARYRLLDEHKATVVRSRKEAFCLAPTDAIDLTVPNAQWNPGSTGLHSACGGPSAIWIREILDVGWGDTYHQSVPGQSFNISDLPNGIYYVEVTANPHHNLREVTGTNNIAYTRIRIGGSPGARTVRCGSCTDGYFSEGY